MESTKNNIQDDKEYRQLAACRRLIGLNSYRSQRDLRQDLRKSGFKHISQPSVSRLLKKLGVVKIRNAKGEKIYALDAHTQPVPDAGNALNEMIASIDYNDQFVLVHTAPGYARAVARIIDYRALPDVLGVVAGNDTVMIAPRAQQRISLLYRKITGLLSG